MMRGLPAVLGLVVSGTAHAHRPHTPIIGIGVDPETSTAWAVLDLEDNTQLMRAAPGATHMQAVWTPVKDETVAGVVWAAGALTIAARDGTIWRSPDGVSWEGLEVPNGVMVRPGHSDPGNAIAVAHIAASPSTEIMALATDVGLYLGAGDDVLGLATRFEEIAWIHVAFSATDDLVVFGITEEGEIWRSANGGGLFAPLDPLPNEVPATAVAEYDGQYFAGAEDGVRWFDQVEEVWRDCGPLPVTSTGDNAGVVSLMVATTDERLAVGTGQQGLFVSEDDCESWQIGEVVGDIEYEGVGSAPDVDWAFTDAALEGDRWWLAGFNGIMSSVDDGESWELAKVVPGDFVRAIQFAPDYPDDPRIFFGGYGGGVWWSDDGGVTFDGAAVGNPGIYANTIDLPADFGSSRTLLYVGNYMPYRSLDAGVTYEQLFVPLGRLRSFSLRGQRLYALGEDGAEEAPLGRVLHSRDDGDTWEEFRSLGAHLDGTSVRDVIEAQMHGEDVILLATTAPAGVLASTDFGQTWDWLLEGPTERSASLAVWPPDAPTRLVFASKSTGVKWSDDMGRTWVDVELAADLRPDSMVIADDGTLLLATRIGQMMRSDDGGATWVAAGEPFAPLVHIVQPAPYFAVRGLVLVGTADGVFFSADRGDHWLRLSRYARYEDHSVHLTCTSQLGGPCKRFSDDAWGNLGGYLLLPGDVLSFAFDGDAFALRGPTEGTVRIGVNGERAELVEVGPAGFEVQDLGAGWKEVEVTVVDAGADGVRVDVVEVFGEGHPVPLWAWQCAGCGGGSGGGAWLWLLPPWWLYRRMRTAVATSS